mmetsp:Transcript_24635/g.77467  ORF Transcript_24635/g.77467 Transcript_24635/m.77467 type:complete len:151 (+) Transcript_24635:745-1197(+)
MGDFATGSAAWGDATRLLLNACTLAWQGVAGACTSQEGSNGASLACWMGVLSSRQPSEGDADGEGVRAMNELLPMCCGVDMGPGGRWSFCTEVLGETGAGEDPREAAMRFTGRSMGGGLLSRGTMGSSHGGSLSADEPACLGSLCRGGRS